MCPYTLLRGHICDNHVRPKETSEDSKPEDPLAIQGDLHGIQGLRVVRPRFAQNLLGSNSSLTFMFH
jgi:hypothetical protein